MSAGALMFSPLSGKWQPSSPPEHGVHTWILSAARSAQLSGLEAQQAFHAIQEQEPKLRAGRRFQPHEIENAINLVFSREPMARTANNGNPLPAHNWPQVDKLLRSEVLRTTRIAPPREKAHLRPQMSAAEILRHLFADDPLVCVSQEFNRGYRTEPLSELKAEYLTSCQFIVPNSMSARFGLTQSGKTSLRALSNTGERRYLVIEIDDHTLSNEDQGAIMLYLARQLPLVMLVHSGNRSVHGWFHIAAGADDAIGSSLHGFMKLAVSLGADRAMWTPCQFARMPNGTRDNGRDQQVLFFDPTLRGWVS
jgi:hypothetical protein